MIATVVRRATARAVCRAFVAAMAIYGIPEEVLTDNGKQFTGRFGKPRPAGVLSGRICRKNGIRQLLAKPYSPATIGKVERWHQTLQTDFLDDAGPFISIAAAQAGSMPGATNTTVTGHTSRGDGHPRLHVPPLAGCRRCAAAMDSC